MSIIAGARNEEEAKKFYDWALTADVQSRAQTVNSFQLPSNKNATQSPLAPDLSQIKLIDYDFAKYGSSDERKRLLSKWDDEVALAAAVAGWRRPSRDWPLHPTVVLWIAVGLDRLRPPALVRRRRRLLELRLGLRRLAARRRRRARPLPRRPGRRSSGSRPSALILLLPLLTWGRDQVRPRLRPPPRPHRRRRPRLALRSRASPSACAAGAIAWLTELFGELDDRQFGMGYGALATALAFLFLLTLGIAARGAVGGDVFVVGSIGFVVATVALFVFIPIVQMLANAFITDDGGYALARLRRPPLQRPPLVARLPDRRPALRRRLELPLPRRPRRRHLDAPRPRLRAGRHPHRLPLPPHPARADRAADHHPGLRHRPRRHPALRPLRRLHPSLGRPLRHAADALGLRPPRPPHRPDAGLHPDRLPRPHRRRRRRQPLDGGGGADPPRQPLADLRAPSPCR